MGAGHVVSFFFFKQKTAYEIQVSLEFRRVLFRSQNRAHALLSKCIAGTAPLPHLLFFGPPGTGKTSSAHILVRALYGLNFRDRTLELNASDERSEERRVGKECRSRWSPYH